MEPIVYYDRYRDELCEEKIYGESSLRWTYETMLGKASLHVLVKRIVFSRWYGWAMNRPSTRAKIAPFIEQYDLDPNEFVQAPEEFSHFNDFFARRLKPESRPIVTEEDTVVFPADGRHLCIPDLSQHDGLFVKGQWFDLPMLLGDAALAEQFSRGTLIMSRLCPVDYHRFHFPTSGTPGDSRWIRGPLYSVNPVALRQNIQILSTNKRAITRLKTPSIGTVLLIEVGATCVGTIRQSYQPGREVQKGDEKGYFLFGGSCTLTLFEPDRITLDADLIEHSSLHREVYARMGDRAAVIR